MFISESFLVGALVVIVFVIIVRGIEEIRAERRWMKRYKARKGGPRLEDYSMDEGYDYIQDCRRHEQDSTTSNPR